MKVLIAAGGTGGHIYPGVAIANYIKKMHPESEIVFVGTNRGLEKDLVPKEGFDIKIIRVKGFERKLGIDTLKTIKEMFLGLHDAKSIVKGFKPDIVIGTGGYVCGPVLFAAWQYKVPTLIHEQNAFPGVTNKILSKIVDKVAVSFPDATKYFKNKSKVIISGNPIRSDFKDHDRKSARERLDIPLDVTLIVTTGGSQGALSINKSMIEVIHRFKEDKNVYIVHITGKNQYENVMSMLHEKSELKNSYDNIKIIPYTYDMPTLFKASDLIIARAGAMTISEICAVGRSSILIPFPYATDNHQEFNARVITDKEGGILILDKDLTGEVLCETILKLIQNREVIKKMEKTSFQLGILNADNIIYNEIKNLVKM